MSLDASEEDPLEVLRRYEAIGFAGQFSARPGGIVHCHTCGADEPAAQTPLEGLHRFEGASDPDDSSALVALECIACGTGGTAMFTYGAEDGGPEGNVLLALLDARDQSPLRR